MCARHCWGTRTLRWCVQWLLYVRYCVCTGMLCACVCELHSKLLTGCNELVYVLNTTSAFQYLSGSGLGGACDRSASHISLNFRLPTRSISCSKLAVHLSSVSDLTCSSACITDCVQKAAHMSYVRSCSNETSSQATVEGVNLVLTI
jgi:hypothetical protein